MPKALKKYIPLLLILFIYWVHIYGITKATTNRTEGHLIYSLDDAYIHMAMAKNLSQNGVYGATTHHFTSSSSSILWTMLLTLCYKVFGISIFTPFILNILFGTILLFLLYKFLQILGYSSRFQFLILVGVNFMIPLPYLALVGLEHTLQILIVMIYSILSTLILHDRKAFSILKSPSIKWWFFAMVPLLTLIRYEGLFLVFAVSLLLLFRKKYLISVLNFFLAFLPILVYGIISLSKGWHFVPNSILLKGSKPDSFSISALLEFLLKGLRQFSLNFHLLILSVMVIVLLWILGRKKHILTQSPSGIGLIFLITFFIHIFFANSGYFILYMLYARYDTYLVAIGCLSIIWLFPRMKDLWSSKNKMSSWDIVGTSVLGFFLLVPFVYRSIQLNHGYGVQASVNIYQQQYQMGRFLKRNYYGEKVVVNDIGAVCYLSDIQCLDVWGLANNELAKLKMHKPNTIENIVEFCRKENARIAVVYDRFLDWYAGVPVLPPSWKKVGEWMIENNVTCASSVVSFYSLNPKEDDLLVRNLIDFIPLMPKELRESKHGIRILAPPG